MATWHIYHPLTWNIEAKYSLKLAFLIIIESDCQNIVTVKCPLIASLVLVCLRQRFLMKIRFCLHVEGDYSIFHVHISMPISAKGELNVAKAFSGYLNMNLSGQYAKNGLGSRSFR